MRPTASLYWLKKETPKALWSLLLAEEEEFPQNIFEKKQANATRILFRELPPQKDKKELTALSKQKDGSLLVEYTSVAAAGRGLGAALAGMTQETNCSEFIMRGFMLDVSRGMVMRPDHLRQWLRRLVLAGCNTAMLYTEDVYELPGEPYFGYARGRYSAKDLRELDKYAAGLGIELIGCMQTLGHCERFLRWENYAKTIKDGERNLLVDAPETYAFIEKMIAFWSKNLKTRRLHIGMDEVVTLGQGIFMQKHGYEKASDIFLRHIQRVTDICRKYDIQPIVWSDMYFRLGSNKLDYYDLETVIPKNLVAKIPDNLSMCYWDYYHADEHTYNEMIRIHRQMKRPVVMGSGVWTWATPWHRMDLTRRAIPPCVSSCRKNGVRDIFFTMWGDDGGYCNYDSALQGLFFGMDHIWGITQEKKTAQRFDAVCQSDYAAHLAVSTMIRLRHRPDRPGEDYSLFSQHLMWDDPLFGIGRETVRHLDNDEEWRSIPGRYDKILRAIRHVSGHSAGDFDYAKKLLTALKKKVVLRLHMEEAYAARDKAALRRIQTREIPACIQSYEEYATAFREQWLRTALPFGLEVHQVRNAGIIERFRECARCIASLLAGEIDSIPELEERIPDGISVNLPGGWYKHVRP